MSVKTIILSLPKDVERRQFCHRELEQFGLTHHFSDAIPGDQLEESDMLRIYDPEMNRSKFKRPLTRSEVACTLGHRRIWQEIANSEDDLYLVLEDDATFVHDPTPFLNAISQSSECFEDVMIKLDGVSYKNAKALKAIGKQILVLSDRLPPRTTGYLLGRKAASRLIEMDTPIARPIDIDLKFYWEHNVPILTLQEQLVAERASFDSNIEAGRRKAKSGSNMNRFIRNFVYQFKYTYGRFRHPLKPEMIESLGPLLQAENQGRNHI